MNIILKRGALWLRRHLSWAMLAGLALAGFSAPGAARPILPSVTISSPVSGGRSAAPLAFAGTAAESGGGVITNVNYWITNLTTSGAPVLSGQAAFSLGPRSTYNWTFNLSPLAGSNVLAVQCQDASGNSSAVLTRKFFVLSPAVFNVAVTGNVGGTVKGHALFKNDTAPANGALLNIGEPYVITASLTEKNTFFLSWTGTGLVPIGPTNSPTLEFIMQPGTTLQANFLTNLFLTRAGTYWGLFSDATDNIGGPTEETAGMIANFIISTRGTYSGLVYFGGSSPTITGLFTPDGYASNRIVITNLDSNVTVQLQLHTDVTPPIITGSVTGTNVIILQDQTTQAGWTSSVTVLAPLTNTSTNARAYTMLLPPNPDANSVGHSPIATGFAYLTNFVGTNSVPSVVTISGLLADWTSFSQTAPINVNNDLPIYQNYYNTPNPGMLFGWLHLSQPPVSPPTITGSLTWMRKQIGRDFGLFTNGFTNHPIVQASAWSNTIVLTNFMPPNSPMVLSNMALVGDPLVFPISITNRGYLVCPSNGVIKGLSTFINTNTGRFQLVFADATLVRHIAYGAILQDTNTYPVNGGGLLLLGSPLVPTNIGNVTWHP